MTYVIPAPLACLPTGAGGTGQVLANTPYTIDITQDRVTESFTFTSSSTTNAPAISKKLVSVINNRTNSGISVVAERVGSSVKITSTRLASFVTVASSTDNFKFIYDEDSYENILTQFQDKDKIKDLLSLFTDQQEELEAAFFELLQLRTITLAPITGLYTSEVLDNYGSIVNLLRGGLENQQYKEALQQKINRNSAEGTSEVIMGATAFLLGWPEDEQAAHPNFDVILTEVFPAGLTIEILDGNWDSFIGANTAIKSTVSAGVEFQLVNRQWSDVPSFQFDSYNPAPGPATPDCPTCDGGTEANATSPKYGFGSVHQAPNLSNYDVGGEYATLA